MQFIKREAVLALLAHRNSYRAAITTTATTSINTVAAFDGESGRIGQGAVELLQLQLIGSSEATRGLQGAVCHHHEQGHSLWKARPLHSELSALRTHRR